MNGRLGPAIYRGSVEKRTTRRPVSPRPECASRPDANTWGAASLLILTLAVTSAGGVSFGKWHLGDTYPLRAMDRGFEEALVHRGGGIGQPSDPPGGEGKYTDPILFRNGQQVAMQGYCTNV